MNVVLIALMTQMMHQRINSAVYVEVLISELIHYRVNPLVRYMFRKYW